MITDIAFEGVVTYDDNSDTWRVDEDSVMGVIADFEGKRVIVTITQI